MKLLSQLSPVRMAAAPDFLVKAETDEAEFPTRAAPNSGNLQQPPPIDDSDIPGLVSNFLVWLLSISISEKKHFGQTLSLEFWTNFQRNIGDKKYCHNSGLIIRN
jgi:hypothetical protein